MNAEQEAAFSVLLAVSDPPLLSMLGRFLRRDGHAVTEVRGGAQLLEAVAEHPFDVIICDDRLSGLPRLSVLVGPHARRPETAFVLLTEDPEMQARARALGALFLLSPLSVHTFRTAVRHAAHRPGGNDRGQTC